MATVDPEDQGPGATTPLTPGSAPQDAPHEIPERTAEDDARETGATGSPAATFGGNPLLAVRSDANAPVCRPDGTCD